jgi:hypothetical protein
MDLHGNMPDVLLCSFDTALRDMEFLRRTRWSLLVVDEAQRLKNAASQLSMALRTELNFKMAVRSTILRFLHSHNFFRVLTSASVDWNARPEQHA